MGRSPLTADGIPRRPVACDEGPRRGQISVGGNFRSDQTARRTRYEDARKQLKAGPQEQTASSPGAFGFAEIRATRTGTCMPIFSRNPKRQTEPPKWPTETNTGISLNRPSNGPSPVRNRKTPTANTPRNRALFSLDRQVLARVRHTQSRTRGLSGGLGSSRGTGLLCDRPANPNRTPSGGPDRSPEVIGRDRQACAAGVA